MKIIAAIVMYGLVPSSILTAFGVWMWQSAAGGTFQVAFSGGVLVMFAGLIWKQSDFQRGVTDKLKSVADSLAHVVTTDRLERRLSEERLDSDRRYVTQGDCDQVHNKLNGRLNGFGNGGK